MGAKRNQATFDSFEKTFFIRPDRCVLRLEYDSYRSGGFYHHLSSFIDNAKPFSFKIGVVCSFVPALGVGGRMSTCTATVDGDGNL